MIDGSYRGKLGDLGAASAPTLVVWLDLPLRVWLPRLVRRTRGEWCGDEELWNGNRETLRSAIFSRDSLILFALRQHSAAAASIRRSWRATRSSACARRARSRRGSTSYSSSAISAAARAAPSVSTGR